MQLHLYHCHTYSLKTWSGGSTRNLGDPGPGLSRVKAKTIKGFDLTKHGLLGAR